MWERREASPSTPLPHLHSAVSGCIVIVRSHLCPSSFHSKDQSLKRTNPGLKLTNPGLKLSKGLFKRSQLVGPTSCNIVGPTMLHDVGFL